MEEVRHLSDLFTRLWVRAYAAVATARREEGQTFTEYAIIVAGIAIGIVGAVGILRNAVYTALSNAANAI